MGYEIVAATAIGSICSIISILLWQRGTWIKMKLEHQYNIKRFRLGKTYKLKEMDMPKKQSKNLLDQLSKLDKNTISRALEFLAPGEEYDTEEPEGLEGLLKNIVANNPDMVSQFLEGLGNAKTTNQQNKPDISTIFEG